MVIAPPNAAAVNIGHTVECNANTLNAASTGNAAAI